MLTSLSLFFFTTKKDFQMKPTREICLKLSKGGGIPGKLRTWKAFKYIYHFHFRFNLSPFWSVVLWYMFHISYFSHSKRRGLWYFLFPLTQGKIFHICLQAFDFIWVFSFDAGMYKASSWTFGTKKSHGTLIYLSAIIFCKVYQVIIAATTCRPSAHSFGHFWTHWKTHYTDCIIHRLGLKCPYL